MSSMTVLRQVQRGLLARYNYNEGWSMLLVSEASHRCTLKLFKIKFFLISEVNHSTLSLCVNTLGQLNVA